MQLSRFFKKLLFFFIRYLPVISSIVYILYYLLLIYNYLNCIYYKITIFDETNYCYIDPRIYDRIITLVINEYNIIPMIAASFGYRFCLYHKLLILHSIIAIILFNITITSNLVFSFIVLFIILSFPYLVFVYYIKKKHGVYEK